MRTLGRDEWSVRLTLAEHFLIGNVHRYLYTRGEQLELDMKHSVHKVDLPCGELVLHGRDKFLFRWPFRLYWPEGFWHRKFYLSTPTWKMRIPERYWHGADHPVTVWGSIEDFRRDLLLLPIYLDLSR